MVRIKKLKINQVTRFFGIENGGIGRYSQDLFNHFSKNKHNTIYRTECPGRSLQTYFLYSRLLLKYIHKKDCNLYHAMSPLECIHLPKEKTVVTIHDLIPLLYQYKLNTFYKTNQFSNFISQYAFYEGIKKAAECKKIICVSEETKENFIEVTNCNPKKVIVIDNHIQDKYQYLKPFKNYKQLTIGTISYLDDRKRIGDLIIAFKKIKDKNLHLFIGGFGPCKNKYIQMAKGDDRISFIGKIPEENMLFWYAAFDVFCSFSKAEGFNLPIVEAARVGRPVITLKDAIIPKKIKDATIQINKNEFKKTINKLKNYKLRLKIGKKLTRWSRQFSPKKQLPKYEKAYREVWG